MLIKQLRMEKRGRHLGFGSLGNDGSFPKAMRSSRGQGQGPRKTNHFPENSSIFEMLASVATQLTQGEGKEKGQTGRSPEEYKVSMREADSNAERGTASKQSAFSVSCHQPCHAEGQSRGTDETIFMNADAFSETVTVDRELLMKKGTHEPSTVAHVENPDGSVAQKHKSEAMDKPVKSCEGVNDIHPMTNYCHDDLEDTDSNEMGKFKLGTIIRKGMQRDGAKELQETELHEYEQSTAVVQADVDSHKLGCCFMDSKVIGVPKADHEFINEEFSRPGNKVDLIMQGDPMLDDDNPQSVSSGSSVEAPLSMEQQAYEPLLFHMKRGVGKRNNRSSSEARDNDGNLSESPVAMTVPAKSSRASYIKSRARRCANNATKMRVQYPRSKRKHHELEGKDASVASSPNVSTPSIFSDRKPGESCVKLSIKSFTVPELFVDLPESATISNLKRSVMEAAINVLGGGFCLRVLLQGKKVLDEAASLLQLGISHGEIPDLDFMLEPNPLPTTSVEDPLLVLCHAACRPPIGCPIPSKGSETNSTSSKGAADRVKGMMEISAGSQMQAVAMRQAKDDPCSFMHESNGIIPSTHALVLHGSNELQGLALVALGPKSQSICKRRLRRPFSVAEVEALVQAVEKLGTGRWRDVKLQAFSQAKHRTYVDLKDKWKTLVHTAQISPHQRRGEPVPQGLLDRVISAHSYWTEHQTKQQADVSLEASFL